MRCIDCGLCGLARERAASAHRVDWGGAKLSAATMHGHSPGPVLLCFACPVCMQRAGQHRAGAMSDAIRCDALSRVMGLERRDWQSRG